MASSSDSYIPNLPKVGNLIIYLVDEIRDRHRQALSLNKLLKLLYIIDKTAVVETCVPVTWLDYSVSKIGPVACDVHIDLMHHNSEQLFFFAEAKLNEGDGWIIESNSKFDDSEFSDYEMDLVDRVIDRFGYDQKGDFIHVLLKDDCLRNGKIDLSDLVWNDPVKVDIFRNARESFSI